MFFSNSFVIGVIETGSHKQGYEEKVKKTINTCEKRNSDLIHCSWKVHLQQIYRLRLKEKQQSPEKCRGGEVNRIGRNTNHFMYVFLSF